MQKLSQNNMQAVFFPHWVTLFVACQMKWLFLHDFLGKCWYFQFRISQNKTIFYQSQVQHSSMKFIQMPSEHGKILKVPSQFLNKHWMKMHSLQPCVLISLSLMIHKHLPQNLFPSQPDLRYQRQIFIWLNSHLWAEGFNFCSSNADHFDSFLVVWHGACKACNLKTNKQTICFWCYQTWIFFSLAARFFTRSQIIYFSALLSCKSLLVIRLHFVYIRLQQLNKNHCKWHW